MSDRLDILIGPVLKCGLIDAEAAERARHDVERGRLEPTRAIALHGRIPSSSIFRALASERGCDFVERDAMVVRPELVGRMSRALITRKLVLPLEEKNGHLLAVTCDPESLLDERVTEAMRMAFNKPVCMALAAPDDLRPLIAAAVGEAGASDKAVHDAMGFVAETIREAFVRRASDIHIEPDENGYRVRFRVDGELKIYKGNLPLSMAMAALSRLKVLAGMDIAVNREPQDGSFVHEIEGSANAMKFDIRLATAPTQHGERATLRLLGTEAQALSLDDLGFAPTMREKFREIIRRPSGLILLTGPTGSGKTTTLYAALREINRVGLNIMTVEDPVEYDIPGVSQMEVDRTGRVTFASALRSLLRHDPDVLMIGEIRDRETAEIALRAAMTGHLVLSTLHTNTAVSAVTRLVDIGCEPYLVAATLAGVVSQRLVRRLCPACRRARPQTRAEMEFLGGDEGVEIYEPVGCLRCHGAGFNGRLGVFEMFAMDSRVRRLVGEGADEGMITAAARSLTTLREDAAAKVYSGWTHLAEAKRIVILED